MNTLDKKRRAEKALEFHGMGYNCSQSVLMAFNDLTGLDEGIAAKISACFGGGFGASGSQCGVLSGMGMVIGLIRWDSPKSKPNVYAGTKELKNKFESRFTTSQCRDLKRNKISCDRLIKEGVEMLCDTLGIE